MLIRSDSRHNKGTILKASVDYIRRLKRDQDKLRAIEDRQRAVENTNRKMLLKMQVGNHVEVYYLSLILFRQ